MKIGIDCRTILNPGRGEQAGVGHYTYYLIKHLIKIDKTNEYVLFFDSRVFDTSEFEGLKKVKVKYFPFFQYRRYLPFSYSHLLITAILNREKLDIYHSPANVIPLTYQRPSVITVHDLAIYKHPEWFPGGQKFSTKILVPKSLQKAKKIIAVSKSTKKDIIEEFGIEENKIEVIYEGVIKEKFKNKWSKIANKYSLEKPYIFYIGTIEPRKNLYKLIEAYLNLIKEEKFSNYYLVLAGGIGYKGRDFMNFLNERIPHKKIRYLGYVSHEEKMILLKNASCFIFPSLYEGFGLPVLEAFSQGVPVITSKVASLPEVAGKAALLVDPNSSNDIQKALKRILSNKEFAKELALKGKKRALNFSWDKCAKETLKVYQKAYQQSYHITKPKPKKK